MPDLKIMANYSPSLLAYDVFEPEGVAGDALPPVIFLHGILCSKKYWFDIPKRVADATKRKVYVLDARNHGDSDWTDDFSFELVANDVANFMDLHSIRKAALVGHSMGGIASIYLALNKPELVEKVVVEDMMVRKLPSRIVHIVSGIIQLLQMGVQVVPEGASEDEVFQFIGKFLKNKMPEIRADELRKEIITKHYLERMFDLKKGDHGRFVFKANMPVLLRYLGEYKEETKETEGTFDGPALFIYGTASEFQIGKEEDNIKKHFPHAELLGIDRADHTVHMDKPEEFVAAVAKFISS